MEAGRELDLLVAKAEGWTWDEQSAYRPGGGVMARVGHGGEPLCDPWWWVPHYSTDMAAVWPIAERLRLSVSPHGESQWGAGQPRPSETEPDTFDTELSLAPTAPHAICLARLDVAGVKVR